MANQTDKNSIISSRETIQRKGGIVILPLREYRKLCERAVPTYYLKGKEAEELDKLVKEGLRVHNSGKTRKIKFLADLD